MASSSNYLKDEILDHATDIGSWTAPTALYLALLKSASAASDTPASNAAKEIETPGSNGYDRETLTMGASSGGVSASTNQITHGPSTTGWSEATHFWIVDATTGGNILWQGALTASKTVGASGSLIFEIGEITVTVA